MEILLNFFKGLPNGAIASTFYTFNAGFLIVGVALLTYNIVIAVVRTAESGIPLGKGNSKFFTPIRIVLAVLLLVPVGNGMSIGQQAILGLANAGSNAASKVWSTAVDSVFFKKQKLVEIEPPQLLETVKALVEINGCVLWTNYYSMKEENPITVVQTFDEHTQTLFYSGEPLGMPKDYCGSVSLPLPDSAKDDDIARSYKNLQIQIFNEVMTRTTPMIEGIMQVHRERGLGLLDKNSGFEIGDLGKSIEKFSGHKLDPVQLARDLEAMMNEAQTKVLKRFEGRRDLVERIKKEGWVGASTWFQLIAKANREASTQFTSTPIVNPPKNMQREIRALIDNWWEYRVAAAKEEVPISPHFMGAKVSVDNGLLAKFFKPINWEWLNRLAQKEISDFGDAINTLIAFGEGLKTAAVASATGIGIAGVTGVFDAINFFTGALLLGVLVAGAALANLLPMIPVIFWIFAIFGWAIFVLEAMIALPIWALVHVSLSGEQFHVEKGVRGYLGLVEVFIRPSLLVLCLIISMALLGLGGALVTKLVAMSFLVQNGTGVVDLGTLIFAPIILALVYLFIAFKAFGFVLSGPTVIMNWIEK